MQGLRDTIGDMLSNDYKARLKAERSQLVIRLKGLETYMGKISPYSEMFDLAWIQRKTMLDYKNALEMRMTHLGIEFA